MRDIVGGSHFLWTERLPISKCSLYKYLSRPWLNTSLFIRPLFLLHYPQVGILSQWFLHSKKN